MSQQLTIKGKSELCNNLFFEFHKNTHIYFDLNDAIVHTFYTNIHWMLTDMFLNKKSKMWNGFYKIFFGLNEKRLQMTFKKKIIKTSDDFKRMTKS